MVLSKREFAQALRRAGYVLVRQKKHQVWEKPHCESITLPVTLSTDRSWKSAECRLRRLGVLEPRNAHKKKIAKKSPPKKIEEKHELKLVTDAPIQAPVQAPVKIELTGERMPALPSGQYELWYWEETKSGGLWKRDPFGPYETDERPKSMMLALDQDTDRRKAKPAVVTRGHAQVHINDTALKRWG